MDRGAGLSITRSSSGEFPAATEPVNEVEHDIALLLRAENRDPFRLLGPHIVEENDGKRLVVRGFFPKATQTSIVLSAHAEPIPALRLSEEGLFEAVLPLAPELPIPPASYRWKVTEDGGTEHDLHDTYAFPPLLSDFDLYLIGEGTHYQKYEKMGAHPVVIDGVLRSAVRSVGSQRHARERRRGFQSVGRPHAPNAEPGPFRRLGIVCAGAVGGRGL